MLCRSLARRLASGRRLGAAAGQGSLSERSLGPRLGSQRASSSSPSAPSGGFVRALRGEAAAAAYGAVVYEAAGPRPERLRLLVGATWAYGAAGAAVASASGRALLYATELSQGAMAGGGLVLGLGMAALPLLLHRLLSRHVLRLHFQERSGVLTAITPSMSGGEQALRFRGAEVREPKTAALLTTALVRGQPLNFSTDPRAFRSQAAYDHLVQADRPLDHRFPELTHGEVQRRRKAEKNPPEGHDK